MNKENKSKEISFSKLYTSDEGVEKILKFTISKKDKNILICTSIVNNNNNKVYEFHKNEKLYYPLLELLGEDKILIISNNVDKNRYDNFMIIENQGNKIKIFVMSDTKNNMVVIGNKNEELHNRFEKFIIRCQQEEENKYHQMTIDEYTKNLQNEEHIFDEINEDLEAKEKRYYPIKIKKRELSK